MLAKQMAGSRSDSKLFLLLAFSCLLLLGNNKNAAAFDFFYLVLEWPGSFCDGSSSCCYPKSGKPPSDFTIHGLWPNNDDGSYPQNCDPSNPFDESQIEGLRSEMNRLWSSLSCPSSNSENFWAHEWQKHGTCSEKYLRSQRSYFSTALQLRKNLDLLRTLEEAGISPNDASYPLSKIKSVLRSATGGFLPGITCNTDESRNSQLYQVYICVSKDGSTLIQCPVLPDSSCPSQIEFPVF